MERKMTRKSKAKQERYCVVYTDDGRHEHIYNMSPASLEVAKKLAKSCLFRTYTPVIFKLVRVRSKPKSGGGGK